MAKRESERQRILDCFGRFLRSLNLAPDGPLSLRANLVRDLGLASEDGIDFACELSEEFGFHFPDEFNPFIHDSGRRARRVGEMLDAVDTLLASQEALT